jgi:hypothetical protein
VTAADARPARASAIARLAVRSPHGGRGRAAAWWPWSIVAAAVRWNLASLRALTLGVAYLNDSSLHEQMVRFATAQLRAGHLPLTSWFPFLGEGSPQFLHYQSLPAIVTGLVGLAVGPDVAFRWSLYLLLSLWPISVYLSARAFGAGRPAAGASAAMAPFLVSATGVGYEQHAYMWTGFGVWTQLWASWTLPLAWGRSWRAIRDGRGYLAAVLLTALTVALQTASLMTDPEYYFDQRNPGDYRLFGIRYLIIATGSRPPVPARLRLRAGPYSLWTLPGAGGVLHAGTIVGHLTANRTEPTSARGRSPCCTPTWPSTSATNRCASTSPAPASRLDPRDLRPCRRPGGQPAPWSRKLTVSPRAEPPRPSRCTGAASSS